VKNSTNIKKQKTKITHDTKATNWAKENRTAIDEYNERIRKNGAFSDAFRSF